jgi:nitronate monooxygenase
MGMVREPPELIEREIAAARARTNRPFGVNLIPSVTDPALFEAEFSTALKAGVSAFCFFWDVMPGVVERAKKAGCLVPYQIGSVAEAIAAERAGADAIIAQGVEAGGHVRGNLPLSALLPEVVAAVKVPVAASGGMVDGADLVGALAQGAAGIHCGTAFLATPESFAHGYHKKRILEAKSGDTVHTDLFVINWPKGAPVRVLRNSVVESVGDKLWGHDPDTLPREVIGEEAGNPVLKYDTNSPLRSMTGDFEKMALYAGEGVGRVIAAHPAAEVIERIMAEANAALDRLEALRT